MACSSSTSPWVLLRTMSSHESEGDRRAPSGLHRDAGSGRKRRPAAGSGRATRLARFLSAADKSYDAVIQLGISTRTGDAEGERLGGEHAGPTPSLQAVDTAVNAFRGTFPQQPPAFSAKKSVDAEVTRSRARVPSGNVQAATANQPARFRPRWRSRRTRSTSAVSTGVSWR